ncbi:hypothetical protein HBH69_220160 [Parastagonospora nodorum]|nr:hypothetical protein HBH69_220160 [Parastagonospora nodorum]
MPGSPMGYCNGRPWGRRMSGSSSHSVFQASSRTCRCLGYARRRWRLLGVECSRAQMAWSYSDGMAVSLATGIPEVGHRQRIVVGPEGPSNPQNPRHVTNAAAVATWATCSFSGESRGWVRVSGGGQVVVSCRGVLSGTSTGRNGGS